MNTLKENKLTPMFGVEIHNLFGTHPIISEYILFNRFECHLKIINAKQCGMPFVPCCLLSDNVLYFKSFGLKIKKIKNNNKYTHFVYLSN